MRKPVQWARCRILPLVSMVLLCLAVVAVVHLGLLVSPDQIMGRITEISAARLCLALVAALSSYCALIGYDGVALQMLGKKVPAATVALGAFSGHAFHNVIGCGPLSGGAVRYRLYSAHGVTLLDVAAISAITAAASGIGLTLICLLLLALSPGAIAGYLSASPATVSSIAATALFVVCLILIVLSSRTHCLTKRFRLRVPKPAVVAGIALVVLTETGFEAATLYLLIGSDTVPFGAFLAVFFAATSAGLLSHVPGGIGVFEAVIMAGLAPSVELTDVTAALVIYRMVYYLIPFSAAALLLGGREFLGWVHALRT